MSGDTVRLAVLGDPLRYTRSPDLHRAGCEALGFGCESVALRTPPAQLGERLASLAAEGYRGVNVTHPLKADVLRHVPEVSEEARRARSANTIGFGDPWWAGTTDGAGFLDWLAELGREPARERTVLLGAGGSARSLALALAGAGAPPPVVTARDPAKRRGAWSDVPVEWTAWRSAEEQQALAAATLVVNCTPLEGPDSPAPVDQLPREALVLDLVYGPDVTPWVRAARRAGRHACDGLGLLVHQARGSLALWFGRDVPAAVLAAAVGWPR